ncbi:MAG: cysteine peptidase family C39 domain-containing protein, partial [Alphaproteobacteria bacterium]
MDTALQCLALVARHHGADIAIDRIKREHAVQEAEVSEQFLIEAAGGAGLEARKASLDWNALSALGDSLPVIARLNNGFSVLVVGIREGEQGQHVMVLDPLSEHVELIAVPRHRFEESWSGSVVFVRRDRAA